MGVPKFFRWMSERYPAISQLISENRIPEFDCLYLDMNGIIHNCTHKDSDDTTFRMSEEQMFITIFNYIELLFGKIKPKQLFYMAIDGVAPRAKMNQQRARRFRTALDVELANEKAIREGKKIPEEAAFDSNSITPGTEFMHKLTGQLKYFISKKISDDTDWQGAKIILSGHEVPGEGEHKIMEYIRLTKAQPEYNPNTRHCLYGLDADLIMLGLLSHDPHFCLLREEVTFGRASKTRPKELEHQKFYLMHLCVVREYLELEFQELKKPGALEFKFDLERVIDDFILMAFFVGNDFLPNLPNLHINEGALALMFKVYKTILLKAGGYLNEGGVINLRRLAILLGELSHVEYRFFEADVSDQNWFKAKKMAKEDVMHKGTDLEKISMTSSQRQVWLDVKRFLTDESRKQIDLPHKLTASERKFFQDFAERVHLEWKTIEDGEGNRHMLLFYPETNEKSSNHSEQLQVSINRIIEIYDAAETIDISEIQAKAIADRKYEEKFLEWKNKYYSEKFDWGLDNNTELVKICENYVQGLQWVLFYYYRGVVSWAWFYRYHYSPMISDVIKGLNVDLNFKLGQPFYPFEQLMGVLPDRSKKIIPTVYHDLMTDPKSPIIDFYPRDFELDMNGKKMEWEAVVKIPFIDETRLLAAMASRNHLLSKEEKMRNKFGVTIQFCYDPDVKYNYPSSLIDIFPDIQNCHCVESEFILPSIEGLEYHIGLRDGVKLGDAAQAGFPSLTTLPYTAALAFHGANVFQSESRNESMVVTLEDSVLRSNIKNSIMKLGKKVYVGYPYLQEGKVSKVSDELFDYFPSTDKSAQPRQRHHNPREIEEFNRKSEIIENYYSKHLCIVIGPVESIIHVEMLKGLRKTGDGATVKEYAVIPGMETEFAAQVIVDEVINEDQRFIEQAALPIAEEFPPGSRAFFLGEFNYGRPLEIIGHENNHAEIWLAAIKYKEQEFGHQVIQNKEFGTKYVPAYTVAQMLGLNSLVLSKITSSFSVAALGFSRLNLGLNLKFESKKLKVLGYTQKSDSGWEYSEKAIELITTYMNKFPEFFAGILRNFRASEYKATDFYPAEIADAKIKEINNWLKSIESKNFEKVPLDSQQLDSDVVAAIEQAIDATLEPDLGVTYKKLIGVPRTALLKPSDAEHRLGHQTFVLGDRVVYVPDSGRVPIATRGIVIGITGSSRMVLLDILCFSTFMSGTTLGGRCTEFRGCTVPKSSVINITNRQVVTASKATTKKQLAPRLESSDKNKSTVSMSSHVTQQGAATSSIGSYRGTNVEESQNGLAHGYGNSSRHKRGRGSSHEKLWPSLTPSIVSGRSGPPRQTGNGRGGREMSREVSPFNNDLEDSSSPSTSNQNNISPPINELSSGARRGSWSRGRPRPRLSRGRGSYHSATIHQP